MIVTVFRSRLRPEATDEYIHVKTSIHDGSLVWSLTPITSSFLIYRDGRIEI